MSFNLLSQRAMLASLRLGSPAKSKTDKQVTDSVHAQNHASADAGRYAKSLWSKAALAKITGIASEARAYHRSMTLAWDRGVSLLPAVKFSEYASGMQNLRMRMESAVAEFEANFAAHMAENAARLNGMFSASDYPTAQQIVAEFGFDIKVTPVPETDDFRVSIGDAALAQIKADLELASKASMESAMRDAWQRIEKVTAHMVEKLRAYKPADKASGEKASDTFRDSLVENARELVALLPAFNLSDDPALTAITDELRIACEPDAETLRKDETVRIATADAAQAILEKVAAFMA